MKKLFHILFLTCKQATYFLSVRNLKTIGLLRRLQLRVHLSMCESCHEFSHQSQIIDQSIKNFSNPGEFNSEVHLSEEKKSAIKKTVTQSLNN